MSTRATKVFDRAAPTDATEPARLDISLRNVALTVIAAAALMALLHWAQAVFIPIVLSLLISYALEPVVRWIVRAHIPRFAAAAVVVATLVGAIGYAGYSLSDDAQQIVAGLPDAAVKLRQAMRRPAGEESTIEQVERAAQELQRTADEAGGRNPAGSGVQRVQIEEPAIDIREYVSWGSANAMAFAGQAILVMFFSCAMLISLANWSQVKPSMDTLLVLKHTLKALKGLFTFKVPDKFTVTLRLRRNVRVHPRWGAIGPSRATGRA